MDSHRPEIGHRTPGVGPPKFTFSLAGLAGWSSLASQNLSFFFKGPAVPSPSLLLGCPYQHRHAAHCSMLNAITIDPVCSGLAAAAGRGSDQTLTSVPATGAATGVGSPLETLSSRVPCHQRTEDRRPCPAAPPFPRSCWSGTRPDISWRIRIAAARALPVTQEVRVT